MIVGCTRSKWPWSSVGIEYASVRTICLPVSECSNVWKLAAKMSFAWLTGMVNASQSPAGEMVCAVMPCDERNVFTRSTEVEDGLTKAST